MLLAKALRTNRSALDILQFPFDHPRTRLSEWDRIFYEGEDTITPFSDPSGRPMSHDVDIHIKFKFKLKGF